MEKYFLFGDTYAVKGKDILEAKQILSGYEINSSDGREYSQICDGAKFICDTHTAAVKVDGVWQPLQRVM